MSWFEHSRQNKQFDFNDLFRIFGVTPEVMPVPHRKPPMTPGQRLAFAVLERAVADLDLTYDNDKQGVGSIREDARRWFRSDREDTWSFRWCSEILGMSPTSIRSGLETKLSRPQIPGRVPIAWRPRAFRSRIQLALPSLT